MITPAVNVTGLKLNLDGKFELYCQFPQSGSGISYLQYQRAYHFINEPTNYSVFYLTPYNTTNPFVENSGLFSGDGNYGFRIVSIGDGINYSGYTTGQAQIYWGTPA